MPKIKYWLTAAVMTIGTIVAPFINISAAKAESCPDVEIIFMRGSGGTRWVDDNYQAFLKPIEDKLKLTDISYRFWDLDYPAVGVGLLNMTDILTTLGAYFSSGDAYRFGKSVDTGVKNLIARVNDNTTCPNTKYVLGGYSQGAMVISKALSSLKADKIIYAATFGDPKLYLPEGKATLAANLPGTSDKNGLRTGVIPAACKGENLSNYRMYVPDCYAYEGLLGSYRPYQPEAYIDKLGTWCNKFDVFCSSYYSITDHVSYIEDGLYDDASKTIFAKILAALGSDYEYIAVHNTAIVVDASGSMTDKINQYRTEALRLARKTLDAGGKVALYEYRDVSDGEKYWLKQHCDFATCDLSTFTAELNSITTQNFNNNDWPESALGASWKVMNELKWEDGATKSLIILTDASYHDSDKVTDANGLTRTITQSDVVKLSQEIDPVNFYIVATEKAAPYYTGLASDTDGQVGILGQDEIEITDRIMARYDSLPRVEVLSELAATAMLEQMPWVEVAEIDDSLSSEVELKLTGSYKNVLVAINDATLGMAEGDTITIGELDRSMVNTITLVPLSETRRGESVMVELGTVIPKAPNTGQFR